MIEFATKSMMRTTASDIHREGRSIIMIGS